MSGTGYFERLELENSLRPVIVRQKNALETLIGFAGGVLLAAFMLSPLFFLGAIWFYKNKMRELEPLPTETGDFWLEAAEKKRFAALHEALAQANQGVDNVLAQGAQLEQIGDALGQADAAAARFQDEYNGLAELPRERWRAFKTLSVRQHAAKFGLQWYIKLVIPLFLIGFVVDLFANKGYSLMALMISSLASLGLAVWCLFGFGPDEFDKRLPRPPLVDMQNLAQY